MFHELCHLRELVPCIGFFVFPFSAGVKNERISEWIWRGVGHFIYSLILHGYCWPSLLLEQWERPINLSICSPLCHNIFSSCQQKTCPLSARALSSLDGSHSCIITLLPLTTCMIVFLTVYYFVSTFQYTLFLNCHFCPTHPNSHSSVYHNNH